MLRSVPLTTGETYHIYNRGAHKQAIFSDGDDYRRFQLNLHIANHSKPVVVREILEVQKYREPFSGFPADKALVDVFAYSLMPNHFHLVLRQKIDGGITRFMKKLGGGYSMYFNIKHKHSGTLFQGPFKSKHIDSDPYHKWIFAYVHLNPVGIEDAKWKTEDMTNAHIEDFLTHYEYSSYQDYYGVDRPQRSILAHGEGREYVDERETFNDLIEDYVHGHNIYTEAETFE